MEALGRIAFQPFITIGNVITSALVLLAVWWIRGIPDRIRAANERKVIDNSDAATLRNEFNELNKLNRRDIHDLKEKAAIAEAAAHKAAKDHAVDRQEYDRRLLEASSVMRESRADMEHLLFIIQCLIDEVKRLDPDPDNNRSIQQADAVLLHMSRKREVPVSDPSKSNALNSAENTARDTKQADISANAAVEVVKAAEESK